MEENLINLLETFGFPVFRQGSLSDEESYPETFFTFWNNSTDEATHYDNQSFSEVGNFDVNIYSTDPDLIYSKLEEAKKLLKQNGYALLDAGHDLGSDEPTHTGRGITVYIRDHSN